MSKFKVGDKVVVTATAEGGYDINDRETESIVTGVGGCFIATKVTKHKNTNYIGKDFYVEAGDFELVISKKKDQKQLPLCYAEEQEKIQEELNSKNEEIEGILNPEYSGGGRYSYVDGCFNINGTFNITQAKALKKWLTKMTATPKKPVKKVAKKKPSKKKDLLKLSRK